MTAFEPREAFLRVGAVAALAYVILFGAALAILCLSMASIQAPRSPGGKPGRTSPSLGLAILGLATGLSGTILEALRPFVGGLYALYGLLLPLWVAGAGLWLARGARRGVPRRQGMTPMV